MEPKARSPVKRTRASGPKVRTGCLTCKSRHVKCDEQKPECIRCASTGRKCEGYLNNERSSASPDGSTTQSSPISPGPVQAMSLFTNQSPKELRSIELFFLKAAPQLSGYFQEPFWNFVLQVSFDEASIRHALVAISAVYEDDTMVGESPGSGTVALKKLSLYYYNRAIRSMVKKMQEKDSIIIPVIGCLLFVCLEFLRRDIWAAIKHIDGGIRMIEQARTERSDALNTSHIKGSLNFETEIVERVMAPLFSSLNITASVFGRPGVSFLTRNADPDSWEVKDLKDMEEAIGTLLDITNRSTGFVYEVGKKKHSGGAPSVEDLRMQERMLNLYNSWKIKFDALEEHEGDNWVDPLSQGKSMLRAVHLTVRLWLLNACALYETSWDSYKAEFEELIRLVEEIVGDGIRFPNSQSKLFSFELGIIPPLELVARKCRYPTIRRRALELLRLSPKRECLFDSFYSHLLNERVMQLEEMALKLPPGQIPTDYQLPPENARIHLVFFAFEEIPGVRGWPVSFLFKPQGPGEEWYLRKELLDAEGSFLKWKPPTGSYNGSAVSAMNTPIERHESVPAYEIVHVEASTLSPKNPIAVTVDV
ncbi:hypothetical protein BT63DRAFT_479256 [Microthyrium microscopicum]|uniref:Zn(2)-C6 fungal-type domain-containing protein n=1 Tax=Microthyrium microscopicum TaxID=703497 RepID=A0A6A6UD80_9PEZI|nr:hypothetical protein BT63DRAFT_479256 [Microthyrium microscopicum]